VASGALFPPRHSCLERPHFDGIFSSYVVWLLNQFCEPSTKNWGKKGPRQTLHLQQMVEREAARDEILEVQRARAAAHRHDLHYSLCQHLTATARPPGLGWNCAQFTPRKVRMRIKIVEVVEDGIHPGPQFARGIIRSRWKPKGLWPHLNLPATISNISRITCVFLVHLTRVGCIDAPQWPRTSSALPIGGQQRHPYGKARRSDQPGATWRLLTLTVEMMASACPRPGRKARVLDTHMAHRASMIRATLAVGAESYRRTLVKLLFSHGPERLRKHEGPVSHDAPLAKRKTVFLAWTIPIVRASG